jgi:diguanylate cyclase (GGDEF)-like protein
MKTTIELARNLKEKISAQKYSSSSGDFNVTVSIGLTAFNRSRHSALNIMISDADTALYKAKSSGRNTIFSARQTGANESSDAKDLILECVLN